MLDKTAALDKRTVRTVKLWIRKTKKKQILSVIDE